jgi:hypothetical protein
MPMKLLSLLARIKAGRFAGGMPTGFYYSSGTLSISSLASTPIAFAILSSVGVVIGVVGSVNILLIVFTSTSAILPSLD